MKSSSKPSSSSPVHKLLKESQLSSVLSQRSARPNNQVFTNVLDKTSKDDEVSFTVQCKTGYTCVGGGCLAREATDFVVSQRDPKVDGWRCMSGDGTKDKTKKVWAICALSCASYGDDCKGDKVVDSNRICAKEKCTASECCHKPPTCAAYTGKCPRSTVKRDSSTPCTSA